MADVCVPNSRYQFVDDLGFPFCVRFEVFKVMIIWIELCVMAPCSGFGSDERFGDLFPLYSED